FLRSILILSFSSSTLFPYTTLFRSLRSKFFKDKIALITGGSRGLGLAIARQICARGGRVALIARDAEELARAKTELDRLATDVLDRKRTRLNSSHVSISYAVFCLKK